MLNSHHTTFVKLCGLVVNIHICVQKKKVNAINTIDTRQYSCYIAADQYNCKKMVLGSIFYYFLTCHFLLVLLGSYPKKFYTIYHFFYFNKYWNQKSFFLLLRCRALTCDIFFFVSDLKQKVYFRLLHLSFYSTFLPQY